MKELKSKFVLVINILLFAAVSILNAQPATLEYSTIIGGSGWDYGHAIAVDDSGYAYIAGQANSSNYPTTVGAFDRTANGNSDILVTKLNRNGSGLVYSTYIGGSGRDDTRKIYVDKSGCVYLTGSTVSSNFPLTNNSLSGSSEGYFLKVNSAGDSIRYSSRWAGGERILVDSEGYLIIMGSTNSAEFPTTENAYSRIHGGNDDLFIAKIDIVTNTLIFSTFLGGSGGDGASSMTIDSRNNIIVAGSTNSENFPLKGNTFAAYTPGKSNVFVTKLKSDGSELIYSTIIGGDDDEWSFDVTADKDDNVYVTGGTNSNNFPVSTSAVYAGSDDAYLIKLSSDGSQVVYSTYIGGSAKDGGRGVVVDKNGRAYLTGCTRSTNFPISSDAYDKTFNGAGSDTWAWGDPFLLVMNPEGTQIEYSTYFGGSSDEEAYGIAIDIKGDIYICGVTSSNNFPTTESAYDRTKNGSTNIYAAKFQFAKPLIGYFGQTPPGDSAIVFAPDIISLDNRLESKVSFSPDGNELYFQIYTPEYVSKIYYTKLVNETWTEQAEASFSENRNIGSPFFSPDGNKLFFCTYNNTNSDIYIVERVGEEWSEPQLLPEPINSASNETSYSETSEGVIYIDSKRSDGNDIDIWRISNLSDQILHAENLGTVVNSADWDFSPCIAPDSSYLIFGSERNGRQGSAHLYISFNKGKGEWTEPVDMNCTGAKVNSNSAHQSGPSLSPDGKFLFFSRHYNETKMDIYWVSTKVVDDIKESIITEVDDSKSEKQIPDKIKLNQNYPNPFNPSTTIKYQLSENTNVKLKIYDTLGQEIKTLVDSFQNIGEYSIIWNATDYNNNPVCSGVYFYSLTSDASTVQKKMMLIR